MPAPTMATSPSTRMISGNAVSALTSPSHRVSVMRLRVVPASAPMNVPITMGTLTPRNRQRDVEPRGREHPHKQIAPEMIGAKGKGNTGRLQGEIDELVGIIGAQQGHKYAERQDRRQDDQPPAALGVELTPKRGEERVKRSEEREKTSRSSLRGDLWAFHAGGTRGRPVPRSCHCIFARGSSQPLTRSARKVSPTTSRPLRKTIPCTSG